MKAILLMFDSLNRHMLPTYGCSWTYAPHFSRLEKRSVVFDNYYTGSMPCMPARRELHTGRYNFLHRSWGPLEPFDDSFPELLQKEHIYTHLVTDHLHYWEDGGATYHNRYNSYEFFRGQEGDKWKGEVRDPEGVDYESQKRLNGRANAISRRHLATEEQHSTFLTFEAAQEFLDTNQDADNWFLQIECYDPHEPFFTYDEYRKHYSHIFEDFDSDWPSYGPNRMSGEETEHMRYCYAAALSMCDHYLGKLMETMDRYQLWDDTMLIVTTDHGFLLGEHGFCGKMMMPFYNELAHIPMYIWDPRCGIQNQRRSSLVQLIDLPLTLLDYFGISPAKDMQGKSLTGTIRSDEKVREAALFGIYGGHVCCTDGDYVYMRGSTAEDNQPLYQYTLLPLHMISRFSIEELHTAQWVSPFSFTKGCSLIRTNCRPWGGRGGFDFGFCGYVNPAHLHENLLYCVKNDPGELTNLCDSQQEQRMIRLMIQLMEENDSPPEQYVRLGLNREEGLCGNLSLAYSRDA